MRPGEIYVVDLGLTAKVRPCLVVSRQDAEAPRNLVVLVPLTTANRGSPYEVALGKLRFLHAESWANVQGLFSWDQARVGRRLGAVTAAHLESTRKALRHLLELS
jgi:mRNA interferase MazF